MNEKRAYITLLSNKSYFKGVLVLYRSLKNVRAKYPFYCLLSLSIDVDIEKDLINEGIECIRLSSVAIDAKLNPDGLAFSHWNLTFDKLQVWGLTQFKKIVFLDADMLIIRNIDSLFEKEPFSAVCADKSYPGNESWTGLNSGLMVIEPDKNVEKTLLDLIDVVAEQAESQNLLVGDQDVIKYYLSDWAKNEHLHLDEGYNLFADHLTFYMRNLGYSFDDSGKPIYVVHFIGKAKPWMNKNLKTYLWLLKMRFKNPIYFIAYRMLKNYINR